MPVLSALSAPSGPWSACPVAQLRRHRRRAEVDADNRRGGGEGQLGDADSSGEFAGTATRQARRPLQPHDAAADGALSSMTS